MDVKCQPSNNTSRGTYQRDLKITSNYKIRKGDEIFIIDNISYDDGLSTDGFDLITCHREVLDHG